MSRDKNRKICLEKICLVSVQSFGVFNGTRQRVIRYAYPLGACCVLRCLNGECESESAALLYVAELWLLASIGPVFFLSSAAPVVLSEDNLPAPTNGAVNGPTFPVWPDECLVVLSCFFFQKKKYDNRPSIILVHCSFSTRRLRRWGSTSAKSGNQVPSRFGVGRYISRFDKSTLASLSDDREARISGQS